MCPGNGVAHQPMRLSLRGPFHLDDNAVVSILEVAGSLLPQSMMHRPRSVSQHIGITFVNKQLRSGGQSPDVCTTSTCLIRLDATSRSSGVLRHIQACALKD